MLLRDLIHIPDHIYNNEFVIKLTEGIERPEETLADYVVTDQLKRQYERALALVNNSLTQGKSQAAFLHGSFGSGKSHFMAVLNLLLSGHPSAWGHPQLSSVTINFAPLREKKLLLLAFHMINATSMESAILGGYTREIQRLHPNAPIPPLYRGEELFADAARLMETMGEEAFFSKFGDAASTAKTALGRSRATSWDRAQFEQAVASPPGDPLRNRLLSALLGSYYKSYSGVQSDKGESFLPFDLGLQVMSQHAHSLGYDGVVLFLDELILWLASMSSNLSFVHGEIQKLVKLVESQHSNRPAPIISIVARQRDLKDLIGESLSGFEQFNFHDQIKHFEKRFDTINLEDTNLPEIISQRILKPKSEQARQQLREHFERLGLKDHVRDVLAHSYDLEDFRKVYPFSPALIETLVAVSSLLQRNRTAIRILMELLVDQRETLTVGQLIPVGDLFDLVSGNYEPYDDSIRRGFESAKRLLKDRFSLCLDDSGLSETAKQTDLRLFKTILLGALVPQVPALRQLTAKKLAALNHGTLKSPIPGGEASTVSKKLGQWNAHIGELRIDPDNGEISLNLTQIDLEKILEGARAQDGPGNRKGTIRKLLFQMLKLDQDSQSNFSINYRLLWRGAWRDFEILYLNVREKSDVRELQAGSIPRLILDYPFDEQGFHPTDDLKKLEQYRERFGSKTRTTVWLPYFLSKRTLSQLGRLIMLDYILTGDRLTGFLSHLAPTDRPSAESMLRNQQNSLQAQMKIAIEMAYGVRPADGTTLDQGDNKELSSDKQLQSLHEAFQPRLPSRDLELAFKEILAQELEAHYPGSPAFGDDREITLDAVRKVWKELSLACKADDGRIEILDKSSRDRLREIAQPLQLGKMGETHFVLSDHWFHKFEKEMNLQHITGAVRVELLRNWINQPKDCGLPPRLSSLIIYTFAEKSQRQIWRQGVVLREFEPDLPPEVELRQMELPSNDVWVKGWDRVKLLAPETYAMSCTSANLDVLRGQFCEALAPVKETLAKLPVQLRLLSEKLKQPPEDSPRLEHARQAAELCHLLDSDSRRESATQWMERLVSAPWSEVPADLAALVRSSKALTTCLHKERIDVLGTLPVMGEQAQELLDDLVAVLRLGEAAKPLAPQVDLAHQQTLSMLVRERESLALKPQQAASVKTEESSTRQGVQPVASVQVQAKSALPAAPGLQGSVVSTPVRQAPLSPISATQVSDLSPSYQLKPTAPASAKLISKGELHQETSEEVRAELKELLLLLDDPDLVVNLSYEVWKKPT